MPTGKNISEEKKEIVLNPCPCCQAPFASFEQDYHGDWNVMCVEVTAGGIGGCGIQTGFYYKTKEEAAEIWNTRPAEENEPIIKTNNSKVNENLLAENERMKNVLDFLGVELLDGDFQYKPSQFDKWVKAKRDEQFQKLKAENERFKKALKRIANTGISSNQDYLVSYDVVVATTGWYQNQAKQALEGEGEKKDESK